MGGRLSRRRDAPANTEQKPAEAQTATQDSGKPQTPEVVETGNLDAVGEAGAPSASLAAKESAVEDAPAQPEPLVSVSEPSPPETEPAVEPTLVAEVQLAPESAPEPAPKAEPIPEAEPTSKPEAEADAVLEPIPETPPAEAPQEQTDTLTQESVPESVISSPALIEVGVSDAAPQSISAPPSASPGPVPADADDPSDLPALEECQATAEASTASLLDLEKCEEPSECVEAGGNLEQVLSDVNEESVSKLLQNLELEGNGPVADPITADVKIDDIPIPEGSP